MRNGFYNNYMSIDSVKRYIELGRLYCTKRDDGFLLFADEESFYHMFICLPAEADINIEKKDKPVLVRNIFRPRSEEDKELFKTELLSCGFKLMGTTLEAYGETEVVFELSKNADRYKERIEKRGYKVDFIDEDKEAELLSLMYKTDYIKYYHEDYLTESEKKNLIKSGGYMGVFDSDSNLCAASITKIYGDKSDGMGIVVKDELKMLGLALILNHERMRWLIDNKVGKMYAWIDKDNSDSIMFHKSLKYNFTGRIAEEWIL